MKKLITIILSVLLIASLFLSCDNATKAVQDELAEVTLSTQADSRSLTVSNPLEDLRGVSWTYKARKVSETQFNYGEKISETNIDLYPTSGVKQKLTLSQGKWIFELFGRNSSDILLYHGTTDEVLILKGLNQITVEVSPYTSATGTLKLSNIVVNLNTPVTINGVEKRTVAPNYLEVTGPDYIITDTAFNGTKEPIELKSGQYTVTVKYVGSEDGLTYAEETVVATVYSGRTTTIGGNISEETGSGTINGNIEIKTEATQTKSVEADTPTTFTLNVAPANSISSSKVENTTVTFAENSLTSDQTAILKVEVKDINTADDSYSDIVTNGSAVAGISLTLTVGGTQQSGSFGNAVIETYIAKGLANVQVMYNGDGDEPGDMWVGSSTDSSKPNANYYESDTGKLVFSTNHFSEYYVISDSIVALNVTTNTAYATLGDAINAASDGDTIVLFNNTSMTFTGGKSCISIHDKDITIDGSGKTITLIANTAVDKYGIYITGSDSSKTVNIKNATIDTNYLERAIRTEGSIGVNIVDCTISTNGVGVHVKGSNKVDIINTHITVNVMDNSTFSAHLRTAVMVGGEDANVTVNGCTINAINTNKITDTKVLGYQNSWCKGLYVGTYSKNAKITANDTKVEADFSIAIDGAQDDHTLFEGKPTQIIINSGEYSGLFGSPSGLSYKSLIINGGTFTGISDFKSFNSKDNDVAKLVISGGKFNVLPDSEFIETGKTTIKGGGLYRVVDSTTDNELKRGVTISGIAGLADSYDTIQDAYEEVKAMLVANSGLVEQALSEESFNAFFTEGGKITWTIYGNQKVTDTRMFSFGRGANRFGQGLHITEINIVGGNRSASLDLSTVNGTFALPYNWWNVEDSVNTTLKCSNITFNGIKSMPSATYQCTLYPTTYEFDGCTFNGELYSYQNFDVLMTIKNCTFNAPANTQYAFMSQGKGGTITLDNNIFNNYTRGINLQRATANFIVTNNTIVSTFSEPDRGAIQLTDGNSFVVTGNTVDINAGNAFWFHNAASNANVTYTISNNDIKAPYIGYSGVTAFDVNMKITSSGNNFNSTDMTKCMKKDATVAEATNLTAIH